MDGHFERRMSVIEYIVAKVLKIRHFERSLFLFLFLIFPKVDSYTYGWMKSIYRDVLSMALSGLAAQ